MRRDADNLQGFIKRVRPLFDGLFQVAYALTGNLELSEYVLRSALLEAYLRRDEWRERMSFREGLFYTLRVVALTELRRIRSVGGYEEDWTPPAPRDLTDQQRALLARLEKESSRTLRMLLLTDGCGMKPSQVAQALSMSAAGIREARRRLTSRLERSFKLSRRDLEEMLEALMDKLLAAPCPDAPSCGAALRAFERDAQGQARRRMSPGRVVGAGFLVTGALMCALLFWLLTVLLEPRSLAPAPSPSAAQNLPITSTNAG